MKFDPDKHHRRSIRLKGYDYSEPRTYFITICIANRHQPLFGKIVNDDMILNEYGTIAHDEWIKTGALRPHVALDEFVVMPNHVHGIIRLTHRRGTARRAPTDDAPGTASTPLRRAPAENHEQFGKPTVGTLPTIVRSYKSAVTKRINELRNTPGTPVWQRNYYEHIIRNEDILKAIRRYIQNNPLSWVYDQNNPRASRLSHNVAHHALTQLEA
ncbi:MAG: transposase [Candidatus Latescibacteria bacterium]|nr:transposase [Candidatus Latescibacterota bacterium]